MVNSEIIAQFNRFWRLYKVDETRFPHRRAATLLLWNEKHPQDREAMLKEVEANGGPKGKNPYFYVQEFAELEPENLNGSGRYDALVKTTPLVSAFYKGSFGIYTLDDALRHNLDIRYGMNFKYNPSHAE